MIGNNIMNQREHHNDVDVNHNDTRCYRQRHSGSLSRHHHHFASTRTTTTKWNQYCQMMILLLLFTSNVPLILSLSYSSFSTRPPTTITSFTSSSFMRRRLHNRNNNDNIIDHHYRHDSITSLSTRTRDYHRESSPIRMMMMNRNNNENNNDTTTTTTTTYNNNNLFSSNNIKNIQKQFQLWYDISLPYYKESDNGKILLIGVIGLTLMNSGISVLFSYTSKDFWNALSEKNVNDFYSVLQKYLILLSIGAPIATLYKYQREQLSIHWREWMTTRTYQLYINNQNYYKLERYQTIQTQETNSNSEDINNDMMTTTTTMMIDNPDQRISEDIKTFTLYSLQFMITLLTSIIDLFSFSFILYNIYPLLFYIVILYAIFGTILTTYIGQSLILLNFQQFKYEADLRYILVRIRNNVESIAFYRGEQLESKYVNQYAKDVMDNKRSINKVQRNIDYFINAYRYLIQILPIAIVAPRYFANEISLGVISQSAGAFNHVLSDLSILINSFESLSTFTACNERLSDFYITMYNMNIDNDKLSSSSTSSLLQLPSSLSSSSTNTSKDIIINEVNTNNNNDDNGAMLITSNGINDNNVDTNNKMIKVIDTNMKTKKKKKSFGTIQLNRWEPSHDINHNNHNHNNMALMIQNLDVCTPDQKRTLIQQLSLQLNMGEHLLIVGPSGSGKSSLLRTIAGLWTVGNGMISRPDDADVYFLPQRPYCTIGTLKDQLLYPSIDNSTTTTSMSSSNNTVINSNGDIASDSSKSYQWKPSSLSDDDLLDILKQVDLYDIAVRSGRSNSNGDINDDDDDDDEPVGDPYRGLYTVQDWSNQLSLGEQQRLAFARLLVNRPALVILDEATSALDIANEARMYTILKNMAQKTLSGTNYEKLSKPGCTYISVGHRPSLISFHDKKLRLAGSGVDHEMTSVEKSSFTIPIPIAFE